MRNLGLSLCLLPTLWLAAKTQTKDYLVTVTRYEDVNSEQVFSIKLKRGHPALSKILDPVFNNSYVKIPVVKDDQPKNLVIYFFGENIFNSLPNKSLLGVCYFLEPSQNAEKIRRDQEAFFAWVEEDRTALIPTPKLVTPTPKPVATTPKPVATTPKPVPTTPNPVVTAPVQQTKPPVVNSTTPVAPVPTVPVPTVPKSPYDVLRDSSTVKDSNQTVPVKDTGTTQIPSGQYPTSNQNPPTSTPPSNDTQPTTTPYQSKNTPLDFFPQLPPTKALDFSFEILPSYFEIWKNLKEPTLPKNETALNQTIDGSNLVTPGNVPTPPDDTEEPTPPPPNPDDDFEINPKSPAAQEMIKKFTLAAVTLNDAKKTKVYLVVKTPENGKTLNDLIFIAEL